MSSDRQVRGAQVAVEGEHQRASGHATGRPQEAYHHQGAAAPPLGAEGLQPLRVLAQQVQGQATVVKSVLVQTDSRSAA